MKNEKLKTFILIGVAVVFAVVGYFRFIYKKSAANAVKNPTIASIVRLEIPKIEIKIPEKIRTPELPASEPLAIDIRDIFKPFGQAPVKKQGSKKDHVPANSISAMTLEGTILGSGKPIAIIDDQFFGVGDRIGDYRVIRIGKNKVLLNSGSRRIELEMVKDE